MNFLYIFNIVVLATMITSHCYGMTKATEAKAPAAPQPPVGQAHAGMAAGDPVIDDESEKNMRDLCVIVNNHIESFLAAAESAQEPKAVDTINTELDEADTAVKAAISKLPEPMQKDKIDPWNNLFYDPIKRWVSTVKEKEKANGVIDAHDLQGIGLIVQLHSDDMKRQVFSWVRADMEKILRTR